METKDEFLDNEDVSLDEIGEDITEEDYEKHIQTVSPSLRKKKVELSQEDLLGYIKRAQKGDQIAWEKIFKAYEPFIVYMKNKTKPIIFGNVTEEDLESYVYEGLVKAVNGFDETKGVKFISFAVMVVKHHVLRLHLRNSRRYYQDDVLVRAEMFPEGVISIDSNQRDSKGNGEGRALAEVIADRGEDSATIANIEYARKLKPLIRGGIPRAYFGAILDGERPTMQILSEKFKISRAAVGDYVMRERRRLQKLVEQSQLVHSCIVNDKMSYAEIAKQFKMRGTDSVAYYNNIYEYLFQEKPLKIFAEGIDFQDPAIIAKFIPFVKNEHAKGYFEACLENEYMTQAQYIKSTSVDLPDKEFKRIIEGEKSTMRKIVKTAIKARTVSKHEGNLADIVYVFGSTTNHLFFDKCYDFFFEVLDEKEVVEMGNALGAAFKQIEMQSQGEDVSGYTNFKKISDEKFIQMLNKFRPLCTSPQTYVYYPLLCMKIKDGASLSAIARYDKRLVGIFSAAYGHLMKKMNETIEKMDVVEALRDINNKKVVELANKCNLTRERVVELLVEAWVKEQPDKEEARAVLLLQDYFYGEAELPEYFRKREEETKALVKPSYVKLVPAEYHSLMSEFVGEEIEKPSTPADSEKVLPESKKTKNKTDDCKKPNERRKSYMTRGEDVVNLVKLVAPFYGDPLAKKNKVFKEYIYEYFVNGLTIEGIANVYGARQSSIRSSIWTGINSIVLNNIVAICASRVKNDSAGRASLQSALILDDLQFDNYCKLYDFIYHGGEKPQMMSVYSLNKQGEIRNAMVKLYGEEVLDCWREEVKSAIQRQNREAVVLENSQSEQVQEEPVVVVDGKQDQTTVQAVETSARGVSVKNTKATQVEEKPQSPKATLEEDSKIKQEPKKRGRKPKQKSQVESIGTSAVVVEEKPHKISDESSVAAKTEKKYQLFTHEELIEKLAEIYNYNMPLQILRAGAVRGEDLKAYCLQLGIGDDWQIKKLLNQAEIEVLDILRKVKTLELSRKEDLNSGEDKYLYNLYQYLVLGKERPKGNYYEELRLISIFENDIDCLVDMSRYRGWLESGLSINAYAKQLGFSLTPINRSIKISIEYITNEIEKAGKVFALRLSGKATEEIQSKEQVSEREVLKYLWLYETSNMGVPLKSFMQEEKNSLLAKVVPYTNVDNSENLVEYLTREKSIEQISRETSKSVIEVKKSLIAGIKTLEERLAEIRLVEKKVASSENSPELQFEVQLYDYLFAGGVAPKKLQTESEIIQKLMPVLSRDKKFEFFLSMRGENKLEKIAEYAKEKGMTEASAINKFVIAQRDYKKFLAKVNQAYNQVKLNNLPIENVAEALEETTERVGMLVNLYDYLYKDGELVIVGTMDKEKEYKRGRSRKVEDKKSSAGGTPELEKEITELPLDKNILLPKIAKMFPFDSCIEALASEVAHGLPFADSLKKHAYSGNAVEELRQKAIEKVETFIDDVVKIGNFKRGAKNLSDRANSFGKKERVVAFYDKAFKHLFGGVEHWEYDNDLEAARLVNLFYENCLTTKNLYLSKLYHVDHLSVAEIAEKTGAPPTSVSVLVAKVKKELNELIEEIVSIKKEVAETNSVLEVANSHKCTVWEIKEQLALFDQIFFGVEDVSLKEKNKLLFAKLGDMLTAEERLCVENVLVQGLDPYQISKEQGVQERTVRNRALKAVTKLNKEAEVSILCKRDCVDNATTVRRVKELGISMKKFNYYLRLYDYIYAGGPKVYDTEIVQEEIKFKLLKPLLEGQEDFMVAYANVVEGIPVARILEKYGKSTMWYSKRKTSAAAKVEEICRIAEECFNDVVYEKMDKAEVSRALKISSSQLEAYLLVYKAVYIDKQEVPSGIELEVSKRVEASHAGHREVQKPEAVTGRRGRKPLAKPQLQTTQKFEIPQNEYRRLCKADVKKFMLMKSKKMSNIYKFFNGEDIEVVAKNMAVSVYSAIDHIIRVTQQMATDSARRGKRDVPNAYEIYCALVPFDEELYKEPLQNQLRVMKVLPWGALTKLLRAVDNTINKLSEEKRNYLVENYYDSASGGFDYAKMLSGEDENVKQLYPQIQNEFSVILDKARQTWQQ